MTLIDRNSYLANQNETDSQSAMADRNTAQISPGVADSLASESQIESQSENDGAAPVRILFVDDEQAILAAIKRLTSKNSCPF